MAKLSTIEFAEKRLNHACEQKEDDYIIQYWRAYLDGAQSQSHEDAKKLEELNKMIDELQKQKEC